MTDPTGLMRSAVLDQPEVDQTGLARRCGFQPDDSQFGVIGAAIHPPADAADAPPNLYTEIQEQMELEL